ncbi:hypothetical protein MZO42_10290 [Sphingomonas psychrotolerans]|uniref:Lipoprotein n=1 Tax=Sphingomonas psychrotolerans TaxID=1327635 RepID=A0ABU3N3I5_9SPHN|nr:hypothetical protein [Sphingomonas psychrotolerans]MDT8759087.1 hypothetical protein [Sphingomonas psychrotolerans]
MRRSSVFAGTALGALSLAGCVAPSQPPVRPASPVPVPTPAPTPAPAPPPASADWRDWPLTPGSWSWRPEGQGSVAAFGLPGQLPELTLRCDRARSRILLSRRGPLPAPALTIRTTSVSRTLAVAPTTVGASAELGVRDTLIDAMGYSRGRFIVESGGAAPLVVPAWAEILRVAEDCR